MEDLKQFLESIGFRKNESEVYVVLLQNGTSSVLDIAKATHLHRSNIYDCLRRLVQEGLVYTISTPTRLFAAREPKSLLNYFQRKQTQLTDLVANYSNLKQKPRDMSLVKVSQGMFSLREAVNSLLGTGQNIDTFGIPMKAPELIGPMLKEFHKERAKRKIIMRHIYNTDGIERAKYLNSLPYTEARILPKKFDSQANTTVSGDRATIFLWDKNITIIEMNDIEIAKTYQNYFEILWSKAKVVK